jgi:hypothetical protein
MQIDTEPFLVNMMELANKKILVRPKVADKDKARALSLVILARQIYHEEWLLRRLRAERLMRPEAWGSRAIGQPIKAHCLAHRGWSGVCARTV